MSEKTPRDTRDEVIRAAILADWQQVALNGGPPCFHVCEEDGHFCFRAKRWAGHDEGQIHAFVSLEALLRAPETQVKVMRCVVCKRNWCPDSYTEACPLCWLDALKKTAPERGWQERAMNLHKHSCQNCDKTDEEFAYVDGWNDALNALLAPPAQTEDSKNTAFRSTKWVVWPPRQERRRC